MSNAAKQENIENVLDVFTKMHKLIYTATQEPTQKLFDVYNEIAAAGAAPQNAEALKTRTQEILGDFSLIAQRLKKSYKAGKVPMGFRMTMPAAISKMSEHLTYCIQAANSIMEYLDTADPAHMDNARELLAPFTQ